MVLAKFTVAVDSPALGTGRRLDFLDQSGAFKTKICSFNSATDAELGEEDVENKTSKL